MKFKVTTPLRIMFFSVTEWIEFGSDAAWDDVRIVQLLDPDMPTTIMLEIVE